MNWTTIRVWNGSQYSGFEELCCQLAAYEKAPAGSKFVRKGAPDAGVECYWRLPTGDEWAWQAKFFLARPTDDQWGQVDKSIKTAIEKHPRLVRYIVCIPVDREDPRIAQQQRFMDKWDTRVATWKTWASAKGMTVEFEYWGTHEIAQRLTLDEHRGRRQFWFGTEYFSDAWYKGRLDEAIANAGVRYTKDLNIDLPIARNFAALGRTKFFFKTIQDIFGELKKKWVKVVENNLQKEAGQPFEGLNRSIEPILLQLEEAYKTYTEQIGWEGIETAARQARELAWTCAEKLQEAEKAYKERTKGVAKEPGSFEPYYDYARHTVSQLAGEIDSLCEFCGSVEAMLSNTPTLLVLGEAGTGKTHLFCDGAGKHLAAGYPAVMLHGGHFDKSEPWTQILRLLGLNCARDEFLGALQAHGEASGGRAIIFIDALNEGDGKALWKTHLAGMLAALARYPQVGLAISVRSSYLSSTIPTALTQERLTRVVHEGFLGHEYEATAAFFSYYKIERPTVPLLTPEFGRPLFLKVFCDALYKRGLTKVPPGLSGMTSIFDFYLDSINEKLADALGFDSKDQLVQRAVEKIAQLMAEAQAPWLPREQAKEAANAFLPGKDYQVSLFRALVAEGLLMENRRPSGKDESEVEVINFSYERFFDHKICGELLKKYIPDNQVEAGFDINKPLGQMLRDEHSAWMNRGLLEALAIQLPERFGKELPDIVPRLREWEAARQAVVESFLWRRIDSFTESTLSYVNKVLLRYRDSYAAFFNALFTVAANPEHPYNGRFLHQNLCRQSLTERDSGWTIFISQQFGGKEAIDRLVDWAWSDEDKTYVNDESALLCSVALAWLLTSPNRFLRDGATKAIVRLLTPRLGIVRKLVRVFRDVNDPYVWERVLAVAYGCSMRSENVAAVEGLATTVFKTVFDTAAVVPNVLIRDYARGVIERAVHLGANLSFDPARARPPYKSPYPEKIPSDEDLKKYSERKEGMSDAEWSLVHLRSSVMGFDDFARYVIGSDHTSRWLNRRIGEPTTPTAKEKYKSFMKSLSPEERTAFESYEASQRNAITLTLLSDEKLEEIVGRPFPEEIPKAALQKNASDEAEAKGRLRAALSEEKRKVFDVEVSDYLDNPSKYYDELKLDIKPLQRWIFQRVLDLGWTVERFGEFDRNVNRHSYSRDSHKAERMGKKYQWIAFYEMLAFMTDNFELRGDRISDESEPYTGPWQFGYTRNIDPSYALRSAKKASSKDDPANWWTPIQYQNWNSHADHLNWIREVADLPDVTKMLEVQHPRDDSKWLVMNASPAWREPTPLGEEDYRSLTKRLWYSTQAYLIRRDDMEKFITWAREQSYWGRWMPEAKSQYYGFLGEFHWAPAYLYYNSEYYGVPGWTQEGRGKDVPVPILPATESYSNEGNGFDCSLKEGINITLPAKEIVDKMSLRWNGIEGKFFGKDGQLLAFDPSLYEAGSEALLLRKEPFCEFLQKSGYSLFWTLLGEKQVIGDQGGDWKGDLEISGTYWLDVTKIEGAFSTKLRNPDSEKNQKDENRS